MKHRSAPPSPLVKRASRYQQPVTPGSDASLTRPLVTTEPLKHCRRGHFLLYFGIGMLLVLTVVAIWNVIVIPAWQNYRDQLHYGDARITRLDADVGHGGTSTFIAFVLNDQVIIIEAPHQSMEHATYYHTANLNGIFSTPPVITLSVADVDNIPNCLIVHVEGMIGNIVLYNNGTGFQVTPPQKGVQP